MVADSGWQIVTTQKCAFAPIGFRRYRIEIYRAQAERSRSFLGCAKTHTFRLLRPDYPLSAIR